MDHAFDIRRGPVCLKAGQPGTAGPLESDTAQTAASSRRWGGKDHFQPEMKMRGRKKGNLISFCKHREPSELLILDGVAFRKEWKRNIARGCSYWQTSLSVRSSRCIRWKHPSSLRMKNLVFSEDSCNLRVLC